MSTEFIDKYGNMLRTLSADDIENLLEEEAGHVPHDRCGALIKDLLISMVLMSQEPQPGLSRAEFAVRVVATCIRNDDQRTHLISLAQAFIVRGLAERQAEDSTSSLDRMLTELRASLERGNVVTKLKNS